MRFSRRSLILGSAAALASPRIVAAGVHTSSSIIDPFILSEFNAANPANSGNYSLIGKTPVALDLTKNNCVLVCFGQSNHSNVIPTPHTAGANVLNFCIYNGATYASIDPQLGCSNAASPLGTGNILSFLGDSIMATGKFDKVILAPASVGGTSVAQWATDSFQRIAVTARRLAAAGLTATAILWQQGENDTGAATSQASYSASLALVISRINAAFPNVPIFIAISSWNAGSTSANVTNAQTAAINHGAKIWAGPSLDLLNATNRQADNIHFNNAAAATIGGPSGSSAWLPSLQAYGAPFV